MIGHHDTVGPSRCRSPRILDVEHPFEHELARPKTAHPVDVAPIQRPVEILVGPGAGLLDPGAAIEVGLDVAEEGLAAAEQHLDEPRPLGGDVPGVAHGQPRRNGEPVLDVGMALAAHRQIDCNEQGGARPRARDRSRSG